MSVTAFGAGKISAIGLFVGAALMEVLGDALIRKGLRGSGAVVVAIGFCVLGCYGLLVNQLAMDFSRLLGAYVGVFALVSVAVGRLAFQDAIPPSTWTGLAVILLGSLIIHLGRT